MAYAETYLRKARQASASDLLCADDLPLRAPLPGGLAPDAAASDLIEARRYYLITLLVATATLALRLFRLIG